LLLHHLNISIARRLFKHPLLFRRGEFNGLELGFSFPGCLAGEVSSAKLENVVPFGL